tara:strand:- start:1533 stop:1724 length:192 start_codon:yes stop_codon:yes gene_type:complete
MSKETTILKSNGRAAVEVDLSLEEVLKACSQYKENKLFEKSLDEYYNNNVISSWDYWSEGSVK